MSNTKNITITGLGTALFVVLSFIIRVPVFENYYICLGYVVMVVYLYSVRVVFSMAGSIQLELFAVMEVLA